jgi:hypothetical protein
MKLTIAKIETAKIPPGKSELKLWDGDVSGLYLRLRSSGARSWVYRYRADGGGRSAAVKSVKLGNYPAVPLEAARKAAKAHAGQVAKGHDPAEQRQETRRREKATLGLLLAEDGPYERSLKTRGIVTTKDVMSRLRRGLVQLMNVDAAKLTRLDFVEAFNALEDLPGAQHGLRKECRAFLEWTVNSGLAPHNVLAGYRRPQKSRTQRIEEAAKRRALTDADLAKVWPAAERCGKFGSMIKLGFLTAMRRGELAGLRWDDIHADRIVLGAAVTKTGAVHQIPLTPLMREILASQPRTTSPLVFPSDRTGRRMSGWGLRMDTLVAAADIGPWKIHDTRRTCRTLMSRCGVPDPAAEMAIGHVKATLIGIYNLDEQWSQRLDAFERVSAHIGKLTGSNVVPITARQSRKGKGATRPA